MSDKIKLLLTKPQLRHLRDLMGMFVPLEDSARTVSEMLASTTNKPNAESALWDIITEACTQNNIVVGDMAPNYAIVPIEAPKLAVVRLEDEVSADDLKKAVSKLEEKGTTVFDSKRRKCDKK